MFEQALLPVQDEVRFGEVRAILEKTFASGSVAGYLGRLKSSKVRAREFEKVLALGLLGREIVSAYEGLGDSDRGQVREMYLSLVERVAPELRARFLKIYAYY